MKPFQIKICGITRVEDAIHALEFGADAIGLNFYGKSLRCVDVATAQEIKTAVGQAATVVGVFVNETANQIVAIKEAVGLDAIQLHGDEDLSILKELDGCDVIRAVRLPAQTMDNDDSSHAALIEKAHQLIEPWKRATAILLDAAMPGQYGGTGMQLNWKIISELDVAQHLILAGGLTPDNVALAVSEAGPDAVDVASGVEQFPGSKDNDLMRRFILSGIGAFARQEP